MNLYQNIDTTSGGPIGRPCLRVEPVINARRGQAEVPVVDVMPSFDQATEIATDVRGAYPWPYRPGVTKFGTVRTVRARTAQEIADEAAAEQTQTDQRNLRDGAVTTAEILISLVDALLAKGTITAADIPAATRQKYVAFKAAVDRLR